MGLALVNTSFQYLYFSCHVVSSYRFLPYNCTVSELKIGNLLERAIACVSAFSKQIELSRTSKQKISHCKDRSPKLEELAKPLL